MDFLIEIEIAKQVAACATKKVHRYSKEGQCGQEVPCDELFPPGHCITERCSLGWRLRYSSKSEVDTAVGSSVLSGFVYKLLTGGGTACDEHRATIGRL